MESAEISVGGGQLASPLAVKSRSQIIIVTGYSGAGKSTVLRALEDIGFYCVDNLPIALLDSFFAHTNSMITSQKIDRIALGIDVRGLAEEANFIEYIHQLRVKRAQELKIFFLTCKSNVLIKRFQETRRKHPLAKGIDLLSAMEKECTLLRPLANMADVSLDTDQLTIHDLRKFTRNVFGDSSKQALVVSLMSFGFKYGVPIESNFVYDVRSLPNPYFIPELKNFNGTQKEIEAYLFAQPEVQEYWQRLINFATYSIEKALQEGRFFMNIAIGCTGGRHRSVAFVEKFAQQQIKHVTFTVKHRDIASDAQYTQGSSK